MSLNSLEILKALKNSGNNSNNDDGGGAGIILLIIVCCCVALAIGLFFYFWNKNKSKAPGSGSSPAGTPGPSGPPQPNSTLPPPPPADPSESLINSILRSIPTMILQFGLSEAVLRSIKAVAPDSWKTFGSRLKSHSGFNESIKSTRLERTEARVGKSQIRKLFSKLKPSQLRGLGGWWPKEAADKGWTADSIKDAEAGEKAVSRAAINATEIASEDAAKIGAEGAAGAEFGPIDAAFIAVSVGGMAIDMANVGGLQNIQSQKTSDFLAEKKKNDDQFKAFAATQTPPVNLPMIVGPMDKYSEDDLDTAIATIEFNMLGDNSNPDPAIQAIITSLYNSAQANGGTMTTPLFDASIISSLTPDQQRTLHDKAIDKLCTQSSGKPINGFCSYPSRDACYASYKWPLPTGTGAQDQDYAEWRANVSGGACVRADYTIHQVCDSTVKKNDLTGKTERNVYRPDTGECVNTKAFCDAYGYAFDANRPTSMMGNLGSGPLPCCYQDSSQLLCSQVLGNTICQGTSMLAEQAQQVVTTGLNRVGGLFGDPNLGNQEAHLAGQVNAGVQTGLHVAGSTIAQGVNTDVHAVTSAANTAVHAATPIVNQVASVATTAINTANPANWWPPW